MYRRGYIAQVPLLGWGFALWGGVKVPQHEQELVFGKIEVHQRERNGVKGQVPRRIPGIFPLVGHGNDVVVQHVEPVGVTDSSSAGPQHWMSVMLGEPS